MSNAQSVPRATRGSAAVEFCVIVPFILILLAAIWDLREYIAHRTDLVREIYVLAEAMADEIDDTVPPFASVLGPGGPLRQRLAEGTVAGAASAALVVRGTTRRDGSACAANTWCPPTVALAWPATEAERVWRVGTAVGCAGANALPAVGTAFAPTETVLAGEGTNSAAEQTWVSRNMSDQEWWIVVDVCIRPDPGLSRGLTHFAIATLDLSTDIRKRVTWPSVHDRDDCAWCSSSP